MSTSLARVDASTGEIITSEPFSLRDYLGGLRLEDQRALAAAYDAACRSLIGPNDVQKEGNREFKTKSAWRKLARHFGISSQIVSVTKEYIGEGEFLATVTTRAVAPWGQTYEEVGACCTDEATGKRVITVADAIATASTRASNRAVSNLIAMGEVSAEEMNGRSGDRHPQTPKKPEEKKMPFGKQKGIVLGQISTEDLQSAVTWCEAEPDRKTKFADLISTCKAVIASRDPRVPAAAQSFEEFPEALDDVDDDLPF